MEIEVELYEKVNELLLARETDRSINIDIDIFYKLWVYHLDQPSAFV